MKITFYILAIWTIASGFVAITKKNIMHAVLALIAFFAGIAGIFFSLRAEFLGAIQVIVYVGAIAVLILFAIMLTRNLTGYEGTSPFSGGAIWGGLTSFAILCAILYSLPWGATPLPPTEPPSLSVADIGNNLMTRYGVPFEVISLLLTAALVGAVVIALDESKEKDKSN